MVGNKMLSIRDFSELTGIKQSTLRYFDDIGLFAPAERGDNGYRYYSPFQIITINMIRVLTDLDISIKEISTLTRCRTPESMLSYFLKKENDIECQLHKLQDAYSVIKVFRNLIFSGINADEDVIDVIPLEEIPIVIGQKNDFADSNYFYDAFLEFCDQAPTLRINLDYPVGGLFTDMDAFLAAPSQPTNFFSVDPSGREKRQMGNYLVGYARGYYGETGDLKERIQAYIKEHDLSLKGPVYNLFIIDELSELNQHNYLLQFAVQVDTKPTHIEENEE
jgi:DNA-binding transcriptional MerR regulator